MFKAVQLLKSEIWRLPEERLPPARRLLISILRIVTLTIRGVAQDDIHLRASALTFYSLLSVVPVMALLFGIAKGFGFEKALESGLYEQFKGQEQVAVQVVGFARTLLENVKGGLVAGVGLVILFYTVIKILSHIEKAFNDIWGVARQRSMGRKMTDYFSLMLICPVFLVVTSAVTVFLAGEVKGIVQEVRFFEAFSPAIFFLLKLLPFTLLWILFTFLYVFIPNTRVNFTSALLAGIIAGTLHVIFQRAYILFQVDVSRYNAIYGSFAALPLFFVWLQISWLIVLLGAEVAFAHQNLSIAIVERESRRISHYFKRLLSLRIVHFLVTRFSGPKAAWEAEEISRDLKIPVYLANQILSELVEAGVVSKIVTNKDKTVAYQPARDTDIITVKFVIDALDHNGNDNIPVVQSPELQRLSETLKAVDEAVKASPANLCLKDI
ncbi:MAG: YihY family inner membrane protein [Deltaproteobacteria bacterium]|nr:YihY family inner membrane protein [Deltaproteobacteria bacterium]